MTPAPDAGPDGLGRAPRSARAPSRRTGIAMAAEAATFALASVIHFATGFTDAAIPELLIAAVLGLGSAAVLSQRPDAWAAAGGTTSFAALGTIVGLTIIATGRQDAPDLASGDGVIEIPMQSTCWRADRVHRPASGRPL